MMHIAGSVRDSAFRRNPRHQHKEHSVTTSVAAPETVALQITPEEAEMVVEGLHMLLNSRRFSFKEPSEDVRQLHHSVYEAVERIEAAIRKASPKRKIDA
jgi:hypothetical protein